MNSINEIWVDFLKSLKNTDFTKTEIERVKKAWEFCKFKHGDQLRKSGELYIIHPLLTANYLLEWKMDSDVIISGLLHDVLEDTSTEKEEIKKMFGEDVLSIVSGVTKVSTISNENRSSEGKKIWDSDESLMNVLLSISSDIRIIIVKLADRLHNMTTINHLKEHKQKRIAKETFDIFANIAGRIGMYDLKTKLLDLSFAVLYPYEYKKTQDYINKFVINTENKVKEFNDSLINLLKNNSIEVEHRTRIKGVYSTNKKMQSENINIKDIYDIFASRIIIKGNELDCYKILGIIHLNFTSITKRFKDYISKPKLNLYQSLHTLIIYEGIYIEIQIRNKEMDDFSSYGLAAHWRYKESGNGGREVISNIVNQVASISSNNRNENIKNISKNKFFDVFVLNDNKWYISNESQTILDVAYKVNSEDFLMISSVTKDHKRNEFYQTLKPGSVIEINYSNKIRVTNDWLDWCTISEAKDKINSFFLEIKNENEKIIKDFLIEIKDKLKNECATEGEIRARIISLGFKSFSEFITFLNNKKINFSNPDIINFCMSMKNKRKVTQASKKIKDFYLESQKKSNFYFKELDGIFYKKITYPKCCSKFPGVDCIGILDKLELIIHKYTCNKYPQNKKQIVMHWDYEKAKKNEKVFNCNILFEIHKDISNRVIASIINYGFKIIELKTNKISNEKLELSATISVFNLEQIQLLIDEIKIKYLVPKIEII